MNSVYHKPVLVDDVLSLVPASGKLLIDFTVGLGGHSYEILKKHSGYKLIGFDQDGESLKLAAARLKDFSQRFCLHHASFDEALDYVKQKRLRADFLLADLGISSWQLDDARRGFSFMRNSPLDMRMNRSSAKSAFEFLNYAPEDKLREIFKQYGQEPKAAKIAKELVDKRRQKQILTTQDLALLVARVKKKSKKNNKKHPATLVFQAVRILVNDEISQLKLLLKGVAEVSQSKGCFAVISFHSLEDRLVKNCFKKWSQSCICDKTIPVCVCKHKLLANLLTKKAIKVSDKELMHNNRARSARLRAVRFL